MHVSVLCILLLFADMSHSVTAHSPGYSGKEEVNARTAKNDALGFQQEAFCRGSA